MGQLVQHDSFFSGYWLGHELGSSVSGPVIAVGEYSRRRAALFCVGNITKSSQVWTSKPRESQ